MWLEHPSIHAPSSEEICLFVKRFVMKAGIIFIDGRAKQRREKSSCSCPKEEMVVVVFDVVFKRTGDVVVSVVSPIQPPAPCRCLNTLTGI